jgi:hypothetical protein
METEMSDGLADALDAVTARCLAMEARVKELEQTLSDSVNAGWHNQRIAELEAEIARMKPVVEYLRQHLFYHSKPNSKFIGCNCTGCRVLKEYDASTTSKK